MDEDELDYRIAALRRLVARALRPGSVATCRLGDERTSQVSFVSQSGSSLAEQHAALLSAENVDSTPELCGDV